MSRSLLTSLSQIAKESMDMRYMWSATLSGSWISASVDKRYSVCSTNSHHFTTHEVGTMLSLRHVILPWLTHPVLFKVFSFPMVLKKLRALTAVSTGTPMVGAALEADDNGTTAAGDSSEMMSPDAFVDILKVLILITAAGYSDRSSRSESS